MKKLKSIPADLEMSDATLWQVLKYSHLKEKHDVLKYLCVIEF